MSIQGNFNQLQGVLGQAGLPTTEKAAPESRARSAGAPPPLMQTPSSGTAVHGGELPSAQMSIADKKLQLDNLKKIDKPNTAVKLKIKELEAELKPQNMANSGKTEKKSGGIFSKVAGLFSSGPNPSAAPTAAQSRIQYQPHDPWKEDKPVRQESPPTTRRQSIDLSEEVSTPNKPTSATPKQQETAYEVLKNTNEGFMMKTDIENKGRPLETMENIFLRKGLQVEMLPVAIDPSSGKKTVEFNNATEFVFLRRTSDNKVEKTIISCDEQGMFSVGGGPKTKDFSQAIAGKPELKEAIDAEIKKMRTADNAEYNKNAGIGGIFKAGNNLGGGDA